MYISTSEMLITVILSNKDNLKIGLTQIMHVRYAWDFITHHIKKSNKIINGLA